MVFSLLSSTSGGSWSQEYSVKAGVTWGCILSCTPSLLLVNDLPDDAMCNIAIHAGDTSLYSKCDWQKDFGGYFQILSPYY